MAEFKLTYATMFNPPEELHARFDKALEEVKNGLGKEYGLIIGGKNVFTDEKTGGSQSSGYTLSARRCAEGWSKRSSCRSRLCAESLHQWSYTPGKKE